MDKKLIKQYNLQEARNHFLRLCEWSFVPQSLDEEGDEEDDGELQQPQDGPMGGGQNGGGMPQGGPDNGGMGQGGGMPQGGPDGGGMPQGGPDDGGMPQGGPDGGGMGQGGPTAIDDTPMPTDDLGGDEGEEDDVLDVDDLTDAQEKMNGTVNRVGKKLGTVDDKIQVLLKSIDDLQRRIQSNNDEIADFKREFEKRNPTPTEKLNLRSLDSYPFNVSPTDYWAQKGMDPNSNYQGYADNSEPTTQEYQITNSDVDDFDERAISQSFNISDDLDQDIKKIFGL